MSKTKTVLLICTGNSCRSVMAAGLFKKLLEGKGDYKIMTAGTAALQGMPPTNEAIGVMSEQNIDVSGHRSSSLSDEMIDEADLILVMETRHKENILGRRPNAKDKVHLLGEFGDIPDPIGKSIEFYQKVFGMIKEAVLRVVKKLSEEL